MFVPTNTGMGAPDWIRRLATNCSFLLSANVVGLFSLYTREHFSRHNFPLRKQLRHDLKIEEQAQLHTEHRSEHDPLTGLPNRVRFTRKLDQLLQATPAPGSVVVLFLDLDRFKPVNDRYGHAVGDHVLKEFARIGRELLRGSDIFGRWGGEEFLVVLPNTTLDAALVIVERLRLAALAIQLPSSGAGLRVSISAGLASYEAGIKTLDNLVAAADAAHYEANERGRDVVTIADESFRMATTGVRQALHRAGAVPGN